MRKRVSGVAAIAVACALAWWFIPLHHARVGWAAAIASAPSGAARYSWTDWSAIRTSLGSPPAATLESRAYDADLLETTALRGASADLATLGLTLDDIDSEMFVQADAGDADILRLTRTVDPSTWKGWTKSGSHWTSPLSVTNEVLANVQLADGGRTLIAANLTGYLATAVQALGQSNPVPDTVAGSPLSAFTYSGDYVCSALAMSHASSADQSSAQDLIARAGEVDPIASFSLARWSPSRVTVTLGFGSHDVAVANANSRSSLAVGAAPGLVGTFASRFTLGQVSATGAVVSMNLSPVDGAPLMGELSSGPVLFATC